MEAAYSILSTWLTHDVGKASTSMPVFCLKWWTGVLTRNYSILVIVLTIEMEFGHNGVEYKFQWNQNLIGDRSIFKRRCHYF